MAQAFCLEGPLNSRETPPLTKVGRATERAFWTWPQFSPSAPTSQGLCPGLRWPRDGTQSGWPRSLLSLSRDQEKTQGGEPITPKGELRQEARRVRLRTPKCCPRHCRAALARIRTPAASEAARGCGPGRVPARSLGNGRPRTARAARLVFPRPGGGGLRQARLRQRSEASVLLRARGERGAGCGCGGRAQGLGAGGGDAVAAAGCGGVGCPGLGAPGRLGAAHRRALAGPAAGEAAAGPEPLRDTLLYALRA